MAQHKKRLVIVGGGFGGIKTALALANEKRLTVTLVSDKDYFVYYPALYATATGGSHLQSIVPLARVFTQHPGVVLVHDEMVGIDAVRKHITLKSGAHIDYDIAVLALGVVTSYFGLEGLREYSYGIKSYDDVLRFKRHLHDELMNERQPDRHYIVVGAGPTGVELSAAMASYLELIKTRHHIVSRRRIHVSLVEAAPRVLPRMSERASALVHARLKKLGVHVRTNQKVESQDDDSIIISGHDILSKTVVWTSGVTNHPFYHDHADLFAREPNGRVSVNEYLEARPDIFVIGDNAATPYTGLAQTALHDALFVAKVIKAGLRGKAKPVYRAVAPPVVIPVGRHWAIFEWHGLRVRGFVASLIRRAADAIGYHDVLPLGQALGAWRAEYITEEDCAVCTTKSVS